MAKQSGEERAQTLAELIRDIRIAMLTTTEADGVMRSRPMATRDGDGADGELWFVTARSSGKIGEIKTHDQVALSYAAPDRDHYVSVSGVAEIVDDRERVRQLWNPIYRSWFPAGSDDSDLVALKVRVEHAEAWDAPSSSMVAVVGLPKAILTGQPYGGGEHIHIER